MKIVKFIKSVTIALLLTFIGFIVFSFVIAVNGTSNIEAEAAVNASRAPSLQDTPAADPKVQAAEKREWSPSPPAEASRWYSSVQHDSFEGVDVRLAGTDSLNAFELDPPYDGMQRAQLVLRRAKSFDVILALNKGNFNGALRSIRVKFDSGPVASYSVSRPRDRRGDWLFIHVKERPFLKRLRGSERLYVRAEVYRQGYLDLEFDVSGFRMVTGW